MQVSLVNHLTHLELCVNQIDNAEEERTQEKYWCGVILRAKHVVHPNSGLRTNPLLSCYCATYRAHRKGPYDESSPTIFIYKTLDIQESTPASGAELWSFVGNSILTVPGHMGCPSTHLKNLNNFFGLFCSEPAFFFFAHVMYESSDHGSRHRTLLWV